jgi:hypothetical protein
VSSSRQEAGALPERGEGHPDEDGTPRTLEPVIDRLTAGQMDLFGPDLVERAQALRAL